jgi:very-short-patch-repair endonuclease
MPVKLTQKQFIEKAVKKHNGFYDYSLVKYINATTKVKIICPNHGEFEQQPNNHLFGQGCILCMGDNVRKARISNTKEFIKKSKKIHGDRYDYSLVNYKTGRDKVIIICNKHGEFLQTPFAHSSPSMKQGCPFCKISKGEDEIEKYLIKNNIDYKRQKKFIECFNPKTNKKLPFDFYLPKQNIVIEYHGEQHYKKTGHFEQRSGGLEGLQYRDNIKKEFCIKNGILYIEISYKEFKNINKILKDKL